MLLVNHTNWKSRKKLRELIRAVFKTCFFRILRTMLEAKKLPGSVTGLDTSLSDVKAKALSHVERFGWGWVLNRRTRWLVSKK